MTIQENQAIQALIASLTNYMKENRDQHNDIKEYIGGVESRLSEEVKIITAHCHEREIKVDAAFAHDKIVREAEVADALLKAEAALQATSLLAAPTPAQITSKYIGSMTKRTFGAFMAVLAAMLSVFAVLEHFNVI